MVQRTRRKLAESRSRKGYLKSAQENKLLQMLEEVTDKRGKQGRRHKLSHILYLSILASLMGATDYNQIYLWIESHVQTTQIKQLLGVEFIVTPKRSAVAEILANVDAQEVEITFRKWINSHANTKGKQLAVDGKVMNGSRYKDKRSIEVLGAVLAESGVIIAHKKIAEKSNEIPALQELIDELGEDFIFTFDAMNTQKNS